MPIYVIEHLDPKLFKWSLIEYKHISKIVGKDNLMFTNVKGKQLAGYGKIESKSVKDLNLENACVLDPAAPKELTPSDAKKFKYFIFGGLLGDHPPRQRTAELLTQQIKDKAVQTRHLGKEQMSTDTAVYVTKKIVDDEIDEVQFVNEMELEVGPGETVIMPYKYVVVNGKPLLAPGIKELMKKGFS